DGPPHTADARARLHRAARSPLFFPFGRLTAEMREGPSGALVFELYGPEFPVRSDPIAVLEESDSDAAEPRLAAAFFGRAAWLKEYAPEALRPEDLDRAARTLGALEDVALEAEASRTAARDAPRSRERAATAGRLEARLVSSARATRL